MKLEKITENKIRIILSMEDLEKNDLTFEDFITNASEFQSFFVNMLDKAEKELGFKTKDCKLLIESFSSSDEIFVFTITKLNKDFSTNLLRNSGKTVKVRKKQTNLLDSNIIYLFKDFDDFCYFCDTIKSSGIYNNKMKIAKDISLYLYNNTYYLVLTNVNQNNSNIKNIFYYLSEFGTLFAKTDSFGATLKEHGKLIMKHNAISTCIKYFVTKT